MIPYALAGIWRLLQGRKGDNAVMDFAHLAAQGQQARDQEQDRKRQEWMFQQQKEQAEKQKRLDALPGQFMRPGVNPLTPNDDEGQPLPPRPPPSICAATRML